MTPLYLELPPLRLSRRRKGVVIFAIMAMLAMPVIAGPIRLSAFAEHARQEVIARYHYYDRLPAHRGDIVDAAGLPLAVSTEVYEVRADTKVLKERDRTRLPALLPRLAAILQMPESDLRHKIAGGGRSVLLRKALPPARAQSLQEMRLRGLRVDYTSKRYYPQKEYAASVLGYTNHKEVGRAGIEFMRHQTLAPVPGKDSGVRARNGRRLKSIDSQPARAGHTITLSIDSRLQFYAHEAVRQALHRHRAAAGTAVVMDAHTGDILALASLPSFNPNNISGGGNKKNRALTDAIEPGSLAKPFIVAAALQGNLVRRGEVFPTAKPAHIGGLIVKDPHIHEDLTVEGILQKSSNIGAAMLAARVGKESVWDLYRRLGFGGGKVLGMPGETKGGLRPHQDWQPADFVTHAYGYGFSVSLLQMLRSYSVFANNGMMVEPRLEAGAPPLLARRVLAADVARRVRTIMEGATHTGGTATRAAIAGYRVAGKTGTTKKHGKNGYQNNGYRAFFIGIVPASRPRYMVAVMIDEPSQNGYTGGAAAAPVFREISRRALLLNGVAPDNLPFRSDV